MSGKLEKLFFFYFAKVIALVLVFVWGLEV
jgi:hypothetical protein